MTTDDLELNLHRWGSGMSSEQALNVASTLDKIVTSLMHHPQVKIGHLDYFSQRNRRQILGWNSKPLEEVKKCIHEEIQHQALMKPDAEAICSEEGSLSYRELDDLASRLAHHLGALGVGLEDFVPLCFDKSIWNVVSMLGVLKAGAAFCPLDPTAPIARLEALTHNVDAKVVLCSPHYVGDLTSLAESVVPVDDKSIRALPLPTPNSVQSPGSTSAGYLIWTSGSTGEPKGTIVEHGAFCTGAKAHGAAMLMSSESRVLQFAAHTFDASLVEIITTLILGGVVCIPSENTRLNDIKMFINKMRVNWAVLTPSFVGFIDPSEVPGLKTLVLAGEAMTKYHVNIWSKINLVNGYGPSECSVAAVVNSHVTSETNPTNIGHAVGAHLWVANPDDHTRLVPVGCVGELLVQGPTLAREYHRDSKRTSESFIQGALYAKRDEQHTWRTYKTGDLVRQNDDGTLNFVGRKDTQVKYHGQRVELGEIEHHLNIAASVKHGIVLLPKSGHFKQRLVSVLSVSRPGVNNSEEDVLKLVEGPVIELNAIREFISAHLPLYMVPSAWIVVEKIPLLSSGKLDRKRIGKWVDGMSDDLCHRIMDIAEPLGRSAEPVERSASDVENTLRAVWSQVLNLHCDQIDLNRSFLSLGGDSISAMQVKARCSKHNISLTVQEILRSKSIAHLATCAKAVERPLYHDEVVEQPFKLSPIQSLFFQLPDQGQGHFNQSFFLRVSRRIQKKKLRDAIEMVIGRHSMLRARFDQSTRDGNWSQRITEDINGSYRLKAYEIDALDHATPAIANSQTCLNIRSGPVFAADLFDITGSDQLLFLVGHHLVIDLVSWRVILEDIEEFLVKPNTDPSETPLSFQMWCQMQAEHSQKISLDKVLPSQEVPSCAARYWDMDTRPNNYGDVTCEGFEIDPNTTSLILTKCHDGLRTETVDILLSALIRSFSAAFPDRSVPAIYNEGHGREPSDMSVDLSRTVGWFTTMYPVFVQASTSSNPIDIVRHVKDFRRKVADNGRPYFASRCLTEEGRSRFGQHWPLEVTFNYLGQYQQLERDDSLLSPVQSLAGETCGAGGTADVGEDTPRFGLFEISAVVAQGKLRFSFTFNRHMRHLDKISLWISRCQQDLGNIAKELAVMQPEATIGDFPLLSLTYDGFRTMTTERLPQVGISAISQVEDIYPCSSMQEGLLISQSKDSAFYAVQVMYEVLANSKNQINTQRLADAWQRVVNRHPLLRTVFFESASGDDGIYDQAVLKQIDADIVHVNQDNETCAINALAKRRIVNYGDKRKPPHRFTICETSSGQVFCKLEVSHTVIDGASMDVIFRDLGLAYEGSLREGSGPLYSNFIGYLQNLDPKLGVHYWTQYLTGLEPCTFPVLNDGIPADKMLHSLRLDFTDSQFEKLKKFCDDNGVTLSNAFHTAWGLTLRCYTDSEDVCFGYLTRDAPIDGIEDAVGPFINMLVCRMQLLSTNHLVSVIDQVQKDYMDSLAHRHTSLAEIQHALRLSGTALFNTALSYRRLPTALKATRPTLAFKECVPIYDPTEYNLSVNIEASEGQAVVDLDYWTGLGL